MSRKNGAGGGLQGKGAEVEHLCRAFAQSTRVRLGAPAGEYGRQAMMPHLESVAPDSKPGTVKIPKCMCTILRR